MRYFMYILYQILYATSYENTDFVITAKYRTERLDTFLFLMLKFQLKVSMVAHFFCRFSTFSWMHVAKIEISKFQYYKKYVFCVGI